MPYFCDCVKRCKGRQREVSRATFFAHRKDRDPLSQFTPAFQQFLQNANQTENARASSSNVTQDTDTPTSRSSTISTDISLGPSRKRAHILTDAHPLPSGSGASLSSFSAGFPGDTSSQDFPHDDGPDPLSESLPGQPGTDMDIPPSNPLESQDPEASRAPFDVPPGDNEDLWDRDSIHLNDLKITRDFIEALQNASLDDPTTRLSTDALGRLRNPLQDQPALLIDEDARLSIDLYLGNPSEITYETNRAAFLRRCPGLDVPTYYRTNRLVADLTGIESIVHHMCINSCIAYTGPFLDLEICPTCSEPRYDQFRLEASGGKHKIARQEFHTIPIGPQLQALYRDPESAGYAHYLREERSRIISEIQEHGTPLEYRDVLHGADLVEAFQDGRIGEDDIVLMFSIDGAQLYAKKASACWIYIWVLLNLAPDRRYKKKHVFIGGFIPGPNNPKNTDSFLFPGLHHICALQKEKLKIWDAALQREVQSKIFLALLTADGPGMMHVTGLVGFHGKHGCRLYCGLPGRREPQGKTYFPVLLKPSEYNVNGCTHEDIDIKKLPEASCKKYKENLRYLVGSANDSQYRARRLVTGISKPSIFLGLHQFSTLPLPKSAGSDIMHLGALNLSDLMISLWRGTIDCTKPDDRSSWTWAVLRGDVWQQHGKAVADALHYLPSSFDRPPRNIAEKLTSGYKAWEFLQYLYGLGPGLLYGVLPDVYYQNYCKLVFGMRLMNQHRITQVQLREAHLALTSFAQEFEIIYYQRLPSQIHFVRPCLHSLLHLPREVICLGPLICSSQWTLERTIGNLGEEIKQHSNPFANLSQRGIRRARTNALKAMIPDLDVDRQSKLSIPRGARDIGDGFILLRARDRDLHSLRDCEAAALREFLGSTDTLGTLSVRRWAKLRIPTGQISYSAWKELEKPLLKRRTARNVKIIFNNEIRIAETYFYIHVHHQGDDIALALVSLYSKPDPTILRNSMQTLWSCENQGDSGLKFINVKTIQAVVAMVPHRPVETDSERFFLVEKPGLDVAMMSGFEEDFPGDEEGGIDYGDAS